MNKYRAFLIVLVSIFLVGVQPGATQNNSSCLLKPHCGADVLSKVFESYGAISAGEKRALEELDASAGDNKGFNTLYEIKKASQKAGFKTRSFKIRSDEDIKELVSFLKDGRLIANITGNRHFCLIQGVDKDGVFVYIPGLNHPQVRLSHKQFLEYWDRVALFIGRKNVDIKKYNGNFAVVSDDELKTILGAASCGNTSGRQATASGSQGTVTASDGSGPKLNETGSSSVRPEPGTLEPVVIRNGNLFLNIDDIAIPTRGLSLALKRHYNAQVVSEVFGWLPEPGAGSWAVENGEYSGQGDRSTTEAKYADLTLELDMQTIQPGANYAWETGWINIRYTARADDPRKPKDCYYFLIHADGKIELAKWQNAVQYFLFSKYTSYIPANKNHIKIEAVGANIKVYVNGNLEIDYTDANPLLAEGKVALESYFSHVHFDNVAITAGGQNYNYDFNQDDNEFIFGYGWTHSYSLRIKEYPNHVTLFRENNSKEVYVPQGDGTYKYIFAENYSKLSKDAAGFSLKTKHGIHYRFDLTGKLLYVEDRNLNQTALAYSNIGGKTLLTSITGPAGRAITLQYGANNMVSRATDPAGQYIQYFYDSNNHLTGVIDRKGNTTSYAYDPTTHNLTRLTDPQGNAYQYNYIYNDRVNDQTDPLGNTTSFDYLWSTVHVINKRGEIYKYNFDSNGFVQSIEDPNSVIERTVNDTDGNPIEHYDKLGHRTNFTYDNQGNVLSIQDVQSNWTRYTYDAAYNQPLTVTDARNNVTTFVYDLEGNLTQIVNAAAGAVLYAYNSYGQVVTVTDPKGHITTFTYDANGNLATKTDALNNVTSYSYDVLGRLTRITDALTNYVEFTYDNNGNPLTVRDKAGNVTTYAYTLNNKLESVTDPLLNTTTYAYDCFGNLRGVTDAQGNITAYTYDVANQMHLNRASLLSVTDALGNVTSYDYDPLDRLIKITDAQDKIYEFSYDNQGNLTSRRDAKLANTTYQYDTLNRLDRINYPDATFVDYTYDPVANITQMQDATGTTTYVYDSLNRLTSKAYPDTTTLTYAYDPDSNRTSMAITGYGTIYYDYDNLDRLTKITTPDQKETLFSYDQLSRRTQLTYPNLARAAYAYDNAGRLTQLTNKDRNLQDISQFIYAYDTLSRRTGVTLLNGSITYAYDTLSRLTQESGTVDGTPFSIGYTYDKVGNRLTSTEDGAISSATHNNLNQLIQSSAGAPKLITVIGTVTETAPVTVRVNGFLASFAGNQFTLENFGLVHGSNTIKAKATDSSGNASTHQISVTYNSSNPATTCTYDANGNLIYKDSGSILESFTYDYEDRLKTYSAPGQSASYAYNGEGERVTKTVNGVSTSYYYDGPELVLERTGETSIYYIHSDRIDDLICDSRGYSYHSDGLGSVVNLTDSVGLEVNDYNYKAFGSIRSQSGTVANAWRYTGRQYDPESGLYFYRNRYYDASAGRFITQDPIGLAGGINLYAYVKNDPLNHTDPYGLDAFQVTPGFGPGMWLPAPVIGGPSSGPTGCSGAGNSPGTLSPGMDYAEDGDGKADQEGGEGKKEEQKKPPGENVRWDEKRQRWVDDDHVYSWDIEPHDVRGGGPHWDRGPIEGGKGEWSPDGINWYPK